MGHGFYGPFSGFGFMPGFGGIFNLIFGLLMVYLIFRVFRRGGAGCCGNRGYYRNNYWGQDHPSETVDEILRRRYAKGEITREQYQQMKDELKQ